MPKIKTKRKRRPEGWEIIEPTLIELEAKMRDVMNEPHEGKRVPETVWGVFRVHHQRSRYIFDLFKRKKISRELYEYCCNEEIADAQLIAKWKKPGYDRLCCLRCIQGKDQNFGTTCICRVPSASLEAGRVVECVKCGCRGCSTGEAGVSDMKVPGKKKPKKEIDIDELPPALAAAERKRRGLDMEFEAGDEMEGGEAASGLSHAHEEEEESKADDDE